MREKEQEQELMAYFFIIVSNSSVIKSESVNKPNYTLEIRKPIPVHMYFLDQSYSSIALKGIYSKVISIINDLLMFSIKFILKKISFFLH